MDAPISNIEVNIFDLFTNFSIKKHFFFSSKVKEIKIPVPFGYLAAKWWGPQDIRPIVAFHGSDDNAGTFDTLIPLLPTNISYLAIDLPGHGQSSHVPEGVTYGSFEFVYILYGIFKDYYKWEKVSLTGHSMGGISCFLFAIAFPEYVDMVISFDALNSRKMEVNEMKRYLKNFFKINSQP